MVTAKWQHCQEMHCQFCDKFLGFVSLYGNDADTNMDLDDIQHLCMECAAARLTQFQRQEAEAREKAQGK